MKFKDGQKVRFVTQGGRTGQGHIVSEGDWLYLVHNEGEINLDHRPQKHMGYNFSLRLANDPIKSGQLHLLTVMEPPKPTVLEKNTPQGKIFRKVYKEFDDLVFLGTTQKDIDDCVKPSSVITPMDIKYLESTGWKYIEESESAEERLKRMKQQRKI